MIHENVVTNRRTSAINLRAFPAQRELIDRACTATHKSLTDFILEAACREAEHVLCDRRHFMLDDESFKAFDAALKAPLSENREAQKLLSGKAQWEN